jgi:hypothetical protein
VRLVFYVFMAPAWSVNMGEAYQYDEPIDDIYLFI